MGTKWIGRDWHREVGALQGAIGTKWIGRDWHRDVGALQGAIGTKWIGRDWHRDVGALQGAIGAKWIGRDWHRDVVVHCRVQWERSGSTAGTGEVVLTNSKPCLSEKGLNYLHLSVQRMLSFQTSSSRGLLYTFMAISHRVFSNLAYYKRRA